MKLIPAIDIKDGKCVRLSQGREESCVIFNDDPVKQAKFFEREGSERIHIVDLDAAFGNSVNNKSLILKIREAVTVEIELGGGIRSEEQIMHWIQNGINFLIIGSMAINDYKTLKKISKKLANKLYISLDDLNGKIMINGWTNDSNIKTDQMILDYNEYGIRGFVFTDISRDGMLTGINISKISKFLKKSKKPMIIGGGLSNNKDLINLLNLNESNLEGVVAGKAFYSGNIDIKTSIKILKKNA